MSRLRRISDKEMAAIRRVVDAAYAAALKEGVKGVAVLAVHTADNLVSCGAAGDDPVAMAELLATGAACFEGFAARVASGVTVNTGEPN
jgi:hypothetical protein